MPTIKTKAGRTKMAQAHSGARLLPKIKYLVLGKGGVKADNLTPKDLTGDETSLFQEFLRKEATVSYPTPTSVRYTIPVNVDLDNVVGINLNEAGLVDEEGTLICMKTFTNKGLESGMTIEYDYNTDY